MHTCLPLTPLTHTFAAADLRAASGAACAARASATRMLGIHAGASYGEDCRNAFRPCGGARVYVRAHVCVCVDVC